MKRADARWTKKNCAQINHAASTSRVTNGGPGTRGLVNDGLISWEGVATLVLQTKTIYTKQLKQLQNGYT